MGDLIKKLIILSFSEFQSFKMNMAWFFSLCSSLFFLSLLSFFTHKLRHTDFPLVRINVPLLWVSVNFCIHCHNYIFKSQLFSVSLTFKKKEKLISALLWCRHWSTSESCWVSPVRTWKWWTPQWQVLFSSVPLHTPSLKLARTQSSSFME